VERNAQAALEGRRRAAGSGDARPGSGSRARTAAIGGHGRRPSAGGRAGGTGAAAALKRRWRGGCTAAGSRIRQRRARIRRPSVRANGGEPRWADGRAALERRTCSGGVGGAAAWPDMAAPDPNPAVAAGRRPSARANGGRLVAPVGFSFSFCFFYSIY